MDRLREAAERVIRDWQASADGARKAGFSFNNLAHCHPFGPCIAWASLRELADALKEQPADSHKLPTVNHQL
jgi:hypothetical protein